jgi:hypothetical protein
MMHFRINSVNPKQIVAATDDLKNVMWITFTNKSSTSYLNLVVSCSILDIDFNISGSQFERVFFGFSKIVFTGDIVELVYINKVFEVWINKTLLATLSSVPCLSFDSAESSPNPNLAEIYNQWLEFYFHSERDLRQKQDIIYT